MSLKTAIPAAAQRASNRQGINILRLRCLINTLFQDTSSIMKFAKKVNSEDTRGIIHFANSLDVQCINLSSLLRDVECQMNNLTDQVRSLKMVLDEYQKQHKDAKLSVMALRALEGHHPYSED